MKTELIQVKGDWIHLKKDTLGWRIVHPIYNDDGSINWSNLLFGGLENLMFLLILLSISGLFMYTYYHDNVSLINSLNEAVKNCVWYKQ